MYGITLVYVGYIAMYYEGLCRCRELTFNKVFIASLTIMFSYAYVMLMLCTCSF